MGYQPMIILSASLNDLFSQSRWSPSTSRPMQRSYTTASMEPIIMQKKTMKLLAALILTVLLTQTGCILLAAGAATGATVAYVRGDLETALAGNPEKVAAATKAAFEEMKLAIVTNEATALDAKVMARTAQDVKIT